MATTLGRKKALRVFCLVSFDTLCVHRTFRSSAVCSKTCFSCSERSSSPSFKLGWNHRPPQLHHSLDGSPASLSLRLSLALPGVPSRIGLRLLDLLVISLFLRSSTSLLRASNFPLICERLSRISSVLNFSEYVSS